MLKEKRDKSKNTDKSENASTKSGSTQNLSSSDSNTSVKEEIPDANKNVDASTNNKKESEDRKSTTPVKTEHGCNSTAENKETMEPIIKSEVKQEDMTPPGPGSANPLIKQEESSENEQGNNFGQSVPVTSASQQQQQQNTNSSNSKQCSNAEYMQQQSQIFVFSTMMANRGADSVLNGHFPSIIAYHCAQPGTKKFLEKHPLKHAQFNRQNQNQWMANMSAVKNKQMMRGNGNLTSNMAFKPNMNISAPTNQMPPQQQPPPNPQQNQNVPPFLTPSMDDILSGAGDTDLSWDPSLDSLTQNGDVANALSDGTNLDAEHFLGGTDNHSSNPLGGPDGMQNHGGMPISPGFGQQTFGHGMKIPDENLTPQERQHREERLATIRRMQKMLFPDEHGRPQDCQQMPHQQGPVSSQESCMKMGGMPGSNNMMGPNMNPVNMNPQMMPGPMQQNCGGMIRGMNPMSMNDMPPRGPPGGMYRGMGMMGMNEVPMGINEMGGMNCGPGMMGNMENAGGMIGHMSGGTMGINRGPGMQGPPQGLQAQMEWNKMQQQQQMGGKPGCEGIPSNMPPGFKKMGQGPPPPYHQTTRSASVPIAAQSPTPGSPINPTSNLSLPSPRAYNSNMNSPADATRLPTQNQQQQQMKNLPNPGQSPSHGSPAVHRNMTQSNPSTPLSAHLSPAPANLKEPSDSNAVNNEGKEPNLMPVPSPQQIQYLNTFEGHELTIQKQPNTGVKDSPTSADKKSSGAVTPNFPTPPGSNQPGGNNQNTSGTSSSNFPIPSSPASAQTPNSGNNEKNSKTVNSSPMRQTSVSDNSSNNGNNTPQHQPGPQESAPNLFSSNSPSNQSVGGNNQVNVNVNPTTCTPASQQFPNNRSDNVPLNPNSSIPPPTKISHFDPISSLAQMSQQLTSSVTGMGNPAQMGMNPGGAMMGGFNQMNPDPTMGPMPGDGMGPGMGPTTNMECGMPMNPGMNNQFNNMGPMQMPNMGPRSMSPKLGFPGGMGGPGMPRMMGRPPMGSMYNGAPNVQVKASAPNTIQYLPSRPQMGGNPRQGHPPNLEFLQRYAGPMNNMDMAGPRMPQQCFQGNPNFPLDGPGNDPLGEGMPPMPQGPGGMMMNNPGMMMRGRAPMRMPMGGGPPFNAPPNSNPFGPKGEQPLPPSGPMGGPGMKPYVGTNTSDPTYAQQYHNFQQQLYATNTRGQLSQQQSFFAPK